MGGVISKLWASFVFFLMYIQSMEPLLKLGGWGSPYARKSNAIQDFTAKLYIFLFVRYNFTTFNVNGLLGV